MLVFLYMTTCTSFWYKFLEQWACVAGTRWSYTHRFFNSTVSRTVSWCRKYWYVRLSGPSLCNGDQHPQNNAMLSQSFSCFFYICWTFSWKMPIDNLETISGNSCLDFRYKLPLTFWARFCHKFCDIYASIYGTMLLFWRRWVRFCVVVAMLRCKQLHRLVSHLGMGKRRSCATGMLCGSGTV